MTFDKKSYDLKYAKEKLKRIPLDVSKEKYDQIKAAADNAGESVNGYIKKSIDMRLNTKSDI
jgi:predicted HicB family RNase H-like nuclease